MDLANRAMQNLDNWEVMHMQIIGILVFVCHLGVEYGVLGIAKYIGFQLTRYVMTQPKGVYPMVSADTNHCV